MLFRSRDLCDFYHSATRIEMKPSVLEAAVPNLLPWFWSIGQQAIDERGRRFVVGTKRRDIASRRKKEYVSSVCRDFVRLELRKIS